MEFDFVFRKVLRSPLHDRKRPFIRGVSVLGEYLRMTVGVEVYNSLLIWKIQLKMHDDLFVNRRKVFKE